MITTFFLPEKVDRQKQCHTLRDRHGQPDPVDADQQRKQQVLMTISTKVRTKEMIADVFPSENAVNIEDAKILIPAKM